MNIIEEIRTSVVTGDANLVLQYVNFALEQGFSVDQVLNEGLIAGSKIVGEKFDDGEYFLPDLMRSGDAVKAAMEVVRPKLLEQGKGAGKEQKILIGTVEADVHDIGKNIVSTTLLAAGYEVFDVGVNITAQKFLEEAIRLNVDVVALSSLMTTTRPFLKDTIERIKSSSAGVRLKVIVGGGAVTSEYASLVKADGYAENAIDCVRVLDALFGEDGKCSIF